MTETSTEPLTAPVETVTDTASDALHDAADAEHDTAADIAGGADDVVSSALDTAGDISQEAAHHNAIGDALDTVGDAMAKHIAEFHTAPPEPEQPEGEPALGPAVEISIPAPGEVSPEVSDEATGDAPVSRKRRVFGKARR